MSDKPMTEHDAHELTNDELREIEARLTELAPKKFVFNDETYDNCVWVFKTSRRLVAALRAARSENERLTRLAFEAVVQLDDQDFARMDKATVLALGAIYDEAPDEWLEALD